MDDINKLQGTWNIASLELEGAKQPDGAFHGAQITIKNDSFVTLSMGSTYKGTFTLNSAATPKTIDMHFSEGPEKDNTSLGIYEIDGDSWRLCLTMTSKSRPKSFTTSPGSGHALETLVRTDSSSAAKTARGKGEADTAKVILADIEFAPVPELQGEWKMVSGTRDGYPLEAMMVNSAKRVVNGSETIVSFGGQMFLRANVKVDKTKSPFEIDYHNIAGMGAGKIQYGIYKLEDGLLSLIYASPGAARPKSFDTKQGDGLTYTIWKKQQAG